MPHNNGPNNCSNEPAKPCDNALTPVNIQCLAGPSSISYANKISQKMCEQGYFKPRVFCSDHPEKTMMESNCNISFAFNATKMEDSVRDDYTQLRLGTFHIAIFRKLGCGPEQEFSKAEFFDLISGTTEKTFWSTGQRASFWMDEQMYNILKEKKIIIKFNSNITVMKSGCDLAKIPSWAYLIQKGDVPANNSFRYEIGYKPNNAGETLFAGTRFDDSLYLVINNALLKWMPGMKDFVAAAVLLEGDQCVNNPSEPGYFYPLNDWWIKGTPNQVKANRFLGDYLDFRKADLRNRLE